MTTYNKSDGYARAKVDSALVPSVVMSFFTESLNVLPINYISSMVQWSAGGDARLNHYDEPTTSHV